MSDNQIEEVKLKTDIVTIIGERIELKKAGRNFKAPCPFHGEKTPSFMVSPELQIFKCFGCSEAGDVFSFLDKYEGMEFGEALRYLAERAGVKLERTGFGESSEKEKLIEINTQVARFYNYILLEHPVGSKALEYLEKQRGVKKETIKEFQLGYSPESSYALTKFLVGKKKFAPADIERAGIGMFRGSNIYDRFNGRVIFPLFDHRGNPIAFAGRILPWDKRETGKYINSPETPLYHKSNVLYGLNITRSFIKKKKVAIVVEGELDLISSYQAGIKNVVAIKGSALTEEQVRLLSRFTPKFILALDSDMAGDAAARRGIKVASDIGVEVKVAKITGYKDPDDAARGNIESYKKDLIGAEGIYDYFIDSVFERVDSQSGAGKSKISKEIVPILNEISDKIVQSHYANRVARKLGVPLEAVMEELGKSTPTTQPSAAPVTAVDSPLKDRKGMLEERFLTLAFQLDPKILLSKESLSFITHPLYKKIVDEYAKSDPKKTFNISDFGASLPKELFSGFTKMVLTDSGEQEESQDELKMELKLIEKELRILSLEKRKTELQVEMGRLEESGDEEALRKAVLEYDKVAKLYSTYKKEDGGGIILNEP